MDGKEVGKTVTLYKKYLWNEVSNIDVTWMKSGLEAYLCGRKSKVNLFQLFISRKGFMMIFLITQKKKKKWLELKRNSNWKLFSFQRSTIL